MPLVSGCPISLYAKCSAKIVAEVCVCKILFFVCLLTNSVFVEAPVPVCVRDHITPTDSSDYGPLAKRFFFRSQTTIFPFAQKQLRPSDCGGQTKKCQLTYQLFRLKNYYHKAQRSQPALF